SDLNQDIIAMARAHDEACVQVFFIRNGKIVGREHYILEGIMDSSRESILSSFVKQFYMAQDYIPKEILIEDEVEDSFVLEEWLSAKKEQRVNIKVPQKGEKKNLIDMVRKNAVEYLEKFSDMNKLKYQKSIGALEELRNIIGLSESPKRIESFDISNIQGVDSIGSMVVFTNGKKDKKEYRRYKIKTVIGPNDYDSMAEIVERRLKYGNFPDLILLDGGKGQVSAVKKVLDKHNVKIPLWGMFKDDKHRTKGLISQEKEIELDKTSNLYRFVASIQEEVHNYAITYHRSLRNKTLTKSILDDIQGIGEKRKKSLLTHFKSIEDIKKASFKELLEVEGMNKASAESVYNFFKS
ncbi:MAG: excinuclease ABC subunit UvrC, partial [Paraclostridium sp.]